MLTGDLKQFTVIFYNHWVFDIDICGCYFGFEKY